MRHALFCPSGGTYGGHLPPALACLRKQVCETDSGRVAARHVVPETWRLLPGAGGHSLLPVPPNSVDRGNHGLIGAGPVRDRLLP